ncbi:hypothetical protein CIB48_g373 [Xylaria polymorpha]|nr:hypothetical protein CIB48_g373 [Xylaria polymorpha]
MLSALDSIDHSRYTKIGRIHQSSRRMLDGYLYSLPAAPVLASTHLTKTTGQPSVDYTAPGTTPLQIAQHSKSQSPSSTWTANQPRVWSISCTPSSDRLDTTSHAAALAQPDTITDTIATSTKRWRRALDIDIEKRVEGGDRSVIENRIPCYVISELFRTDNPQNA